jgi:hypothetical protein
MADPKAMNRPAGPLEDLLIVDLTAGTGSVKVSPPVTSVRPRARMASTCCALLTITTSKP